METTTNFKPRIAVILGSTRQQRKGGEIAQWVMQHVQPRTDASFTLLDLRDWPLPLFDEPIPPSFSNKQYENEVAQRWSKEIASYDAFIIVTPEYNHSFPAVLKNALDYLYSEWNNKPVNFVSYSAGTIAGSRAVQHLRPVVINLKMLPLAPAVHIGKLDTTPEHLTKQLNGMVDEVVHWAVITKQLRSQ